jgi:threonine/homoserine/homoserine lactone efflux protein
MEISLLLRGLMIGLSIAAPVGPISVLCIRRTLASGWMWGFMSGLGAATADAIYGCIAGFGLTFIAHFFVNQQIWLKLVGGAFLCYMGVRTFVSVPARQAAQVKGDSLARAYISTLFLTLTNPATILSFAAIFSGLGLASLERNDLFALLMVLGVFVGSMLWWLLLCSSITLFAAKLTMTSLKWANRVSGAIITTFGLLALLSDNWGDWQQLCKKLF